MGTVKVDNLVNQSGDQDSGLDLATNDQVKIKTANATRVTVTDATTTVANALAVGGTSNLTIADGNLIIGTSGHGIDFSATSDGSGTDTSEVLSDYEEGTWTPYFLTGHSYGPSYAQQFGRYVKIGGLINAQYWIRMAGTLHSDGAAVRVAGLPYVLGASGSEVDSYSRGLGSVGYQDYNTNAPAPYGDNGIASFSLHYNSQQAWSFGSNGSTHGSSGNGKYFIGGITYTIDM